MTDKSQVSSSYPRESVGGATCATSIRTESIEHDAHRLDGSVWPPFLQQALDGLEELATVEQGLSALIEGLAQTKAMASPEDWAAFGRALREHPVMAVVRECPATARAATKPRGYAGDAVLLDLLYGDDAHPLLLEATARGRELTRALAARSSPSLRRRLDRLASVLDEVAAERSGASVLSVACGHLREAQRARSVREGAFGRFVALDQDPESLAVVQREQASRGVTCVEGTVKQLLTGRSSIEGRFDLVYAAGLYDYLPDPVAQRLTRVLVDMLEPGGRLVIASFQPGGQEFAYMDLCMEWPLIYRTRAELAAFLPTDADLTIKLYSDPWSYVGYAEVRRRPVHAARSA